VKNPEGGLWSPNIPCARCGDTLPFANAVKQTIEEGWVGYVHPTPCEIRVRKAPRKPVVE
jgi:hypothetical protein